MASESDAGSPGGGVALKKEIGILEAVSLIVGVIVGSGIFVSPGGIAAQVGSIGASLLIWAFCGLISLVFALCYAEIGTTIPASGADYSYIKEIFSPFLGFLALWMNIIFVAPCATAAMSLSFAEYVLLPIAPYFCHDSFPATLLIRMIAILVVTIVAYINITSVSFAAKTQVFFTATKVVALLVIVGFGIYHACTPSGLTNFENAFEDSKVGLFPLANAICIGIFTYGGWDGLNNMYEELKNPTRTLPVSIVISLLLVTGIYLLVNFAYFTVLTPFEISSTSAVASSFASTFVPSSVSWIMNLFVICSVFGSLNGCMLCMSRLFYVGARDGVIPPIICFIHARNFTPAPALLVFCLIVLALQQYGDIFFLMKYCSFVIYLTKSVTMAGLLYLRVREPDRTRPIRMPLFLPIIVFVFCIIILVVIIYNDTSSTLFLIVGVVSGAIFYMVMMRAQRSEGPWMAEMRKLSIILQKTLYVVPPATD